MGIFVEEELDLQICVLSVRWKMSSLNILFYCVSGLKLSSLVLVFLA